ncbi:sigma-70 family RNA polymerase sigma factor [Litorilinea aerophila]|uniref:RNA polymerase sigma factor n=1 Tax=Litorilinea aerophila TaxID=1204385 RepID=A0A540VKV9_9CHLR|nr:sigma-70 family RNA polymerase sigma factor [Litorilinea aerophila]MCC9075075.1 sigma-70 family RNA polymerase sigma factor [Litorilinea aerophila]OUC08367.1 hypothetical protein RY27_09420 [Litorilinea aerophila]
MAQSSQEAASPDDQQLIQLVRQRDQHALMALYQRYGQLVFSLAMRVLQEQGAAEEVTQDVFLKIWQQPERWQPQLGQFSSWLLTITRNAAIDRLRAEQRRSGRRVSLALQHNTLADPAEPVGNARWVDGQILRRLMGYLPDDQRQVIELAYFGGFTHSELAQELGLPLGTVKTRLRIGLQKLRQLWMESVEFHKKPPEEI